MSCKNSSNKICFYLPLLLVAFFMCGSNYTEDQPPNHSSETGRATNDTPQKWALLVGVNEYKSNQFCDLNGCVNDVTRMKEILVNNFHSSKNKIITLIDKDATQRNITRTFISFFLRNSKIQKDDIVLFYYSGHGTKIADTNGDEPDGWDEAIAPYDARAGGNEISDDTIHTWLNNLKKKTPNLIIIFDSCHSGSATRDRYSTVRYTPPASGTRGTRDINTPTSSGKKSSDWMDTEVGYAFISGCRHYENSHEFEPEPGLKQGVLSYYLQKTIKGMKSPLTYRELTDKIRLGIEGTRYRHNQHPVVEGDLDKQVFSGITVPGRIYYNITEIDGQNVTIDAGEVHLIAPGSILAVYHKDVKQPEKEKNCLAQLFVDSVFSTFSLCHVVKKNAAIPPCKNPTELSQDKKGEYKAVMLRHNFGKLRVPVSIDNIKEKILKENIETRIKSMPFCELTAIPEAEIIFSAQGDTIYGPLVDKLCIKTYDPQSNEYLDQVETELLRLAQRKNLSLLNNPYSDFKLKVDILKVTTDSRRRIKNQELLSHPRGEDRLQLTVGEKFRIRITNESTLSVWISILDLQTDGGVRLIYPIRGARDNEIAEGDTLEIPQRGYFQIDEPLGIEKLQIICTSEWTSFESVEIPGCKRDEAMTRAEVKVPDSPLEMLFAHPLAGKRSHYEPAYIDDWTVETIRFEVVE